jgi:hypothetical protein
MYLIHGRIKPKTSWNYNKTDKFFFWHIHHFLILFTSKYDTMPPFLVPIIHFLFFLLQNMIQCLLFLCPLFIFYSFLFSWWIKIFIQISLNFLTLPSKGLIFLRGFTPRWFITCLYAVFYIFLRSSTCDKSLIPLREFQSTL